MLEIKQCPMCGSTNSEVYPSDRFSFKTCLDCDMVYQSPRMDDAEIDMFYSTNDYRKTRAEAFAKNNIDEMPRARRVASWINGVGRFLDVGCARGYLVKFMLLKGWDALGVEPNPDYPFPELPTVRSLDEVTGEWDVITCIHVLEHVSDFKGMADKMVKLLKPGGLLIVEVPGIKSKGVPISTAHLSYFKPHVMKRLFGSLKVVHELELSYSIHFFTKEALCES